MEQRQSPRVPFEMQAIAYFPRGQVIGQAINLSAHGMLLELPQTPKEGDVIRLVFALGSTGQWVDVDAAVVRDASSQRPGAWGVQFLDPSLQLVALLKHFTAMSAAPPS